MQLSLFKKPA